MFSAAASLRCVALFLAMVGGGGTLFSQGTPPESESAAAAPKSELEPWQEEQILDKARIAEESYQRLFGLEEAGNPHWRPGTVLEGAQLAPAEPELNSTRRERALRTFASRKIDWSAPVAHATSVAVADSSAPEKTPVTPERRGRLWLAIGLLAALVGWRWLWGHSTS